MSPVYPAAQSATQTSNVLAPVEKDLKPDGHGRQLVTFVAPILGEYVLYPQSSQASDPGDSTYFPGKHAMHGARDGGPCLNLPALHAEQFEAASSRAYPALQRQSVVLSLPRGDHEFWGHARQVPLLIDATVAEYLPSSHDLQLSWPGASLYLPASHAEQ